MKCIYKQWEEQVYIPSCKDMYYMGVDVGFSYCPFCGKEIEYKNVENNK